jgi:hypothetical protein
MREVPHLLAAVATLVVAVVLTACGANNGSPALKVGDCFDVPTSGDIVEIPTKPCTQEHGAEVFHEFDAPSGSGEYPADDAWAQLIYPVCDPAFEKYTGTPVEDRTDIDYLFLVPTGDRWAAGDRHVTCFIRSLDGSPLRQSYRKTG